MKNLTVELVQTSQYCRHLVIVAPDKFPNIQLRAGDGNLPTCWYPLQAWPQLCVPPSFRISIHAPRAFWIADEIFMQQAKILKESPLRRGRQVWAVSTCSLVQKLPPSPLGLRSSSTFLMSCLCTGIFHQLLEFRRRCRKLMGPPKKCDAFLLLSPLPSPLALCICV